MEFKPTRLYIKRLDNLYYFGKTVKEDIVGYLGGGVDWNEHLDAHGRHLVEHVWNSDWFYSEAEVRSFAIAFSEIFDIVRSPLWANRMKENGTWGGDPNTAPGRLNDGALKMYPVDDPRWETGEIVSTFKGTVRVKDKDGKVFRVPVDDPRRLSGELVAYNKGTVMAKDKDNNYFWVSVDDPRWETGEIFGKTKGTRGVRTKDGIIIRVSVDDPRIKTGELIGLSDGMVNVKDKNGNGSRVSVNDPRYLSGELVGASKNHKYKFKPCPECGKEVAINNMNRHIKASHKEKVN